MVLSFLILFVVFLVSDDAFKMGISKLFSGRIGRVLNNQAGVYDNDMVRPTIHFSLGEVLEVSSFLKDYDIGAKIQGVYAVQDAAGTVMYVGTSMTVPVDIIRHSKKLGGETVHSIRIQTFPTPKPEAIEAYQMELIRQLSPSGNLDNRDMWEDVAKIEKLEVKIKTTESSEAKEKLSTSKMQLAEAVGGDNNVAPIDTIESPFAEGDTESFVISPNVAEVIEFTIENVDRILDEVRPYLIADGGNVEVVSVDEFTRSVSLKLQGACGSCPSSTVSNIFKEILIRYSILILYIHQYILTYSLSFLDDYEDGD
jgi:hypothetical protein